MLQPLSTTRIDKNEHRIRHSRQYTSIQNRNSTLRRRSIYVEYGVLPEAAGEREKKRWNNARRAAMEGRFDDVDDDIYIRCHSSIHRIAIQYAPAPPDRADLDNRWFYGSSGAGKSRHARTLYPPSETYWKDISKWWDGYRQADHKCVIIDDIDPTHTYLTRNLKIWCDHYSFHAETKGGGFIIRPATIIVTSQYTIEEIFSDPKTIEALKRRFVCTEFLLNNLT